MRQPSLAAMMSCPHLCVRCMDASAFRIQAAAYIPIPQGKCPPASCRLEIKKFYIPFLRFTFYVLPLIYTIKRFRPRRTRVTDVACPGDRASSNGHLPGSNLPGLAKLGYPSASAQRPPLSSTCSSSGPGSHKTPTSCCTSPKNQKLEAA
jgi:hypothetical protein